MLRTLTGRLTAWLVLLVAVLAAGAIIGGAGDARTSNDPTATLPDGAESTRVAALQRQLPSGQTNPALIVYSRGGAPLTAEDTRKITADAGALRASSPPVFSERKDAALIAVPLPSALPADDLISRVDSLRQTAKAGLPDGLTAQVTGGAGFAADIADSFTGANTNLLIVTVVVVTLLLLITYRSPVLWLVPLAVVGTADQVSSGLVAFLSRHTSLTIGDSTVGIVTVLVFGAGTDYALLLISRYREELHRHEDRREAMRRSLRGAGPAIAASAATVVLSLLTLLLASLADTVALGVTAALGIGVAALFALVVLPAALVVCGRGLFWPFIPRVGETLSHGLWSRVGTAVARRPGLVTVVSLVVLGALSAGIPGTSLGLSQTEQFRVEAESVDGLDTLSRSFPAGAADPAVVLTTPARAQEVLAAVTATPGVAQARVAEQTPAVVRIDAVLTAAPDTPESFRTIRTLRSAVNPADALVGGTVATNLDARDASRRDLKVIVPVILLVVLLVLGVLLRAAVAALLLIGTVIASFAAALGAGSLLFRTVLDYPGLDNQVPLFSFLFLVALGVDYNIFLVTRAREEAGLRGTRDGMIHALAATGAVITSAGILLAAVFAVLGVLPIITLTQIGVIVGLGVLLDTLLVRTVLVPALATLLGDRFWWPARPAAAHPGPEDRPEPAGYPESAEVKQG
ncbi:membrane protein [Actinoplanes sp. NBRC 14428]|uniref:RND superfamily putative drug exporter n=1 Tax=Pseudosporangium ferrugineum TaxID=439699 RepID=A0A2T0SI63_9ACTN|nr:MMPL family transporter [Pseudosporangium ferrugineum]PRY33092.1 RND superfamily putative drug exporter [Pseudosporangium ferrugineum]BCJ48925.1 membrane protein [Actinoplanes sp. NBRC 14428]